MNTEKEIVGTIILIVEDEGIFKEKIREFISNNKNLFFIEERMFDNNLNLTILIKKVINELEAEGFTCKIDNENNLIVKKEKITKWSDLWKIKAVWLCQTAFFNSFIAIPQLTFK